MSIFPIRTYGYDKLKYIFPTKQRDVKKIIDYAENDSSIKQVVIFGSAITWNCRNDSDIDIAIKFEEDEKCFRRTLKFFSEHLVSDFDIIEYDKIENDLLKNEIDVKGVVVYDKSNSESS